MHAATQKCICITRQIWIGLCREQACWDMQHTALCYCKYPLTAKMSQHDSQMQSMAINNNNNTNTEIRLEQQQGSIYRRENKCIYIWTKSTVQCSYVYTIFCNPAQYIHEEILQCLASHLNIDINYIDNDFNLELISNSTNNVEKLWVAVCFSGKITVISCRMHTESIAMTRFFANVHEMHAATHYGPNLNPSQGPS